jgi:hypothetical protein
MVIHTLSGIASRVRKHANPSTLRKRYKRWPVGCPAKTVFSGLANGPLLEIQRVGADLMKVNGYSHTRTRRTRQP